MLTMSPLAREGRESVTGGVPKRPVSDAEGSTGFMKGLILPLQGWKMVRQLYLSDW